MHDVLKLNQMVTPANINLYGDRSVYKLEKLQYNLLTALYTTWNDGSVIEVLNGLQKTLNRAIKKGMNIDRLSELTVMYLNCGDVLPADLRVITLPPCQ